jgi:protein-tyrosine kinase
MTLIESALQKMQLAAKRPAVDPTRYARSRVETPAGPATEPAKAYLPATMDAAAMEHYCVLPQVKDDIALRSYKILRTRLLQRMSSNQWRSMVVTGTDAQQGKTLTATNLAYALAQDPQTSVFLVDLDLRRPQIARSHGMQIKYGLSDYLAGTVEADEIIYESGVPRLAIIPNGTPTQHSSELLGSPRMAALAQTLYQATPHRYIVYDMPPLMMSDDVMIFAPQVDGVLMVVTEGSTERGTVEKAREVLGEMNILGVVLNRSAETNDAGYY